MSQISYVVRNAVQALLGANPGGFNDWVNQVAPEYQLEAKNYQIDFANPGTSFFIGQFAPATLEESGNINYPALVLYATSARNDASQMIVPSEFSGAVAVVMDVYHSFETSDPPADAETPGDMIEDVMFEIFNGPNSLPLLSGNIVYNHFMSASRSPIVFGGNNWRQLIRFNAQFSYVTGSRS